MSEPAVSVEGVWKSFRLYHERNQYIKAAVLRGRRARYEEFWALKGIDIEVPHGATYGIIGSNGSGKSTLLKCLAGILFPDKGTLRVNGRVSALLELGAGFHPELSGRENVYLNGAILGMTRKEVERRFDDIVEFAGLEKFIDAPVKNYSSGMTVRLGFAIAANVEPEILLIDEVLSVGDEAFQRRCAEKIEEFRQDGRTIVFVSHGLAEVQRICETVAWIDKGDLRMVGPAGDVVSAYTGESHDAYPVDPQEHGSRWGSGEAQITAIHLLDADGEPQRVFTSLEPMTIRMEIVSHVPVHDPAVYVRFDSLHGVPLWATNTRRRGQTIARFADHETFDFVIPRLPLLEGVYDITASITDYAEHHPYDHWEKRVRFEVKQSRNYDLGLVYVDGTWERAESNRPVA